MLQNWNVWKFPVSNFIGKKCQNNPFKNSQKLVKNKIFTYLVDIFLKKDCFSLFSNTAILIMKMFKSLKLPISSKATAPTKCKLYSECNFKKCSVTLTLIFKILGTCSKMTTFCLDYTC